MTDEQYPKGKMSEDDEGVLDVTLAITDTGEVVISFKKPVAWLGLDPDTAFGFARLIAEKAHQAQKKLEGLKKLEPPEK